MVYGINFTMLITFSLYKYISCFILHYKTWTWTKLHYNFDHHQPGAQLRRSQIVEEAFPKSSLNHQSNQQHTPEHHHENITNYNLFTCWTSVGSFPCTASTP